MNQKVLLAVDAGGTKTEYCVKLMRSGDIRRFVYGGSNYKSVGLEKTRANLIEGFLSICSSDNFCPADVQGAVFGISGCDTDEDLLIYSEMIRLIGLRDDKTSLYNDCELAFRATTHAPGLCVVAGTGSNCMAFHPSKPFLRAGGWGALLSDGGSGYWIASHILKDMLLFYDGIGRNRAVFKRIAEHFLIKDHSEIPARFTVMDVSEIASAARVILECAESGDPYAQKISRASHKQLWALAATLIRQMDYDPGETLDIVLNGSLFSNDWFLAQFWQGLAERVPNPLRRHLTTTTIADNAMHMAHRLYA